VGHLGWITCAAISAAAAVVTPWHKGTPWADPGAVAIDAYDGQVAVTRSGSVNWRRAGYYDVVYSAVDGSGNRAVAVRRVHVIK